MKNVLENKRVAIVGGGPAGLTLARLLQQVGVGVYVYERDVNAKSRAQGTTLDLHEESGLAALQTSGLMDAFLASYRPGAEKLRIFDQYATLVLDEHAGNSPRPNDRPEIDRGPLRDLLLNSLQPGTVVWDSQLTALTSVGDGWRLSFHNGTSGEADVVIGADGANSQIRPLLMATRPVYSGYAVVEGLVYDSATNAPAIHALLKEGKIFVFGNNKSLIISAKGDGSLAFYAGFAAPETWAVDSRIDFSDRAQVRTWFGQAFEGWHPVWLDLFDGASLPCVPRPQYYMPPDRPWPTQPNLTLIGDAAHVMPPYAGEGVNMAMLDALELSQCLTTDAFDDLPTAIAHFESRMRARAADVTALTLSQTAILHSPDAIDNMLAIMS